jgi:hypothetical protein
MHTILISRGNLAQRLEMKKMLEGELFLEEINNPVTGKVEKINLWACPENGVYPINLLAGITGSLNEHSNLFNTCKGLRDPDDPQFDLSEEQELENWDPLIHPHGATSNPRRNRIASFDENGRLRSNDPSPAMPPASKDENTVVTLRRAIKDYLALKTMIDNLAKKEEEDIAALINGAPGVLDTLKELADALGDDPDFAATVLQKIAGLETAGGD